MEDQFRIYIAETSMITAIGANTAMSAAAFNAGISAFVETDILNKKLKPIKMAMVPDEVLPGINSKLLTQKLPDRQLRLIKIASTALIQLAAKLPVEQPLPLYLALPEYLPEHSAALKGDFIKQLILQSGVPLNQEESLIAKVGRAGGLHAVEIAQKYLSTPGNDYVIIGGVDSYWDPYLLAKLDAEDRILVEGNGDGFIPGEGACFLLLASDRVKGRLRTPYVELSRPGFSNEKGHRYSEEVYKGDGLAKAAKKALDNGSPPQVDSLWTSMIYDGYCYKELGVTLTRNQSFISDTMKINHPADCFGDLGAAVGCTLLATISALANNAKGMGNHLVLCSSDLQHRAAICVKVT